MAMRTFVAVSMLASLTLVAPATFARGGRGGGGHGGGHSSSGGHGSFGGGAGHASFGSFASHNGGHASFRGESSSTSTVSSVVSTPAMTAGRRSMGYENPYASSYRAPAAPVVHQVVVRNDRGSWVPDGPVSVAGRVRGQNPGVTVRGAWVPRYQFRVPAVYRSYFSPYVAYVDDTYWATDWVITDALVSEEVVMEGPTDLGAPTMDGAVKEELREEIAVDLSGAAETEASADDPRIRAALSNPAHIFLVSKDVDVQNQKSFACALRPADIVRPLARISPEDRTVTVVVLAAKGGECAAGEQVTLAVSDLAEFERALLTRVDHAREAERAGDAAPAQEL